MPESESVFENSMVLCAGRLSCRRALAVRRFPGSAAAQAEKPKLISVIGGIEN